MAKVESWGRGRKDYSTDVQISTIPFPHSYQEVAFYTKKLTIPPNSSKTFSAEFESPHFIYDGAVSTDANVLIAVDATTEGYSFFNDYGYQHIPIEFPSGFPVNAITITIYNYSDVEINVDYYHIGLKGMEEVTPIQLTPP